MTTRKQTVRNDAATAHGPAAGRGDPGRVHVSASRLILLLAMPAAGCRAVPPQAPPPAGPARASAYPTVGMVERLDPSLDALVAPGARVEVLAQGFKWSEGPVWRGGELLFSDVPRNHVLVWREGAGVSVFLEPSGYTGATPRGGEPGSNGLTLDAEGRLVLCQHGDRRVARLESDKTLTSLADRYEGKRFNSPNDVIVRKNGDVYFTDPPYGLEGHDQDPKKEIPWSGVYRRAVSGQVTLLTKELKFPNGLALSPDDKTLYVSNSDPDRAIWMAYDVTADGGLAGGRVFFDATALAKGGKKGLPDGMKIDAQGNLFATGPGGVLVFNPAGKHLGTIVTGEPTANCAFGEDGSALYMTANDKLCRIRLATRGHAAP
jgi:gluconolactonase